MSRPSFLGRSEANFSAASSSVHVLTPRPWLPLSSFTFLLDDACHLLLDGIRPLLFKLIVVYCPTRHSHSSSLIHVLASSNLIVVCISLRSPPLRRCPSSLPRIWSSCNIILIIHLCLDDNLSRLIKIDSRVYFLIHLCPWWYRHLLINDVRPLPLEFDCRVYLTGHSFPLRWYNVLTSSNLNVCISPHSPPPRLASLSRHTINFGDEREDTMVEHTSLMTKMSAVGPRATADMTTPLEQTHDLLSYELT